MHGFVSETMMAVAFGDLTFGEISKQRERGTKTPAFAG